MLCITLLEMCDVHSSEQATTDVSISRLTHHVGARSRRAPARTAPDARKNVALTHPSSRARSGCFFRVFALVTYRGQRVRLGLLVARDGVARGQGCVRSYSAGCRIIT